MTENAAMERLVDRFVAAIENADIKTLDALYTADAVVWRNYDNTEQTREQNMATIATFPDLFKSFKYAKLRRHFFGQGFVLQHIATGVKANGQPFEVPVCMVFAVRGEKISRIDEYFDSAQDARPPEYR